jgi:D-sedoheptulose 7-phosphate isomerase
MVNNFQYQIREAVKLKNSLLTLNNEVNEIIKIITKKIKSQGKILICGNGGSAADSQHLVTEFIVRLRPHVNRIPIPAISLVGDSSTITACGNDYNFDQIFKRNLQAIGCKKDILLILSTSGNSKNIIEVLKLANKMGILSVGILGNKGGLAKKYCNYKLIVNSLNVARTQEAQMFLGHYIFEKVEDLIISNK